MQCSTGERGGWLAIASAPGELKREFLKNTDVKKCMALGGGGKTVQRGD